MSIPLVAAGTLATLGAVVHAVAGEALIRRLSPEFLPSSRFGGSRMTKSMIHITWHTTTIAYLTVGCALVLAGSVLHGEVARGIGVLAAGASTGYAALALGLGAAYTRSPRSPRSLLRHPGPAGLIATAVLAWWGLL